MLSMKSPRWSWNFYLVTDLAEVKAILDNPNVTIIPPAAMSDEATEPPAEPNT